MWQIISTAIFYLMFALLLFLLWQIWRNSVKTQEAQHVLNSIALKNAEAAQTAAEAAFALARRLEKLGV